MKVLGIPVLLQRVKLGFFVVYFGWCIPNSHYSRMSRFCLKIAIQFQLEVFFVACVAFKFRLVRFWTGFYNFLKGISSWPEISRRLFGSFLKFQSWHRFWLNIFQPELTKWIVFYFSFKIYLPSNVEKYTNILGQRSRFLCLLFVIRRLHKTALQQWLTIVYCWASVP